MIFPKPWFQVWSIYLQTIYEPSLLVVEEAVEIRSTNRY